MSAEAEPGLSHNDTLTVGQRFESGWIDLNRDDLTKFWVGTRLDRAYGDFDDSYVPGFYLVALLDPLAHSFFAGCSAFANAVNYGFDRLRFTAVVLPRDELRLVCTVASIEPHRFGNLVSLDCELELKSGKPAVVARWLFLLSDRDLVEG
ncbi:hypothetical protein G6M85_21815 [Agrobacterium tumefaciens]|uniref:MaoC family dehydratase n=1 Tax=Agrobacterium tumefaciens TaxID=358 RepID=UPI001572C98C|nr:hypothetical protein [Agrobacterium tumefaciens]NTE68239.1 hypothetical protein [Agrobacterium tumefaciens]